MNEMKCCIKVARVSPLRGKIEGKKERKEKKKKRNTSSE